MRGFANRIRATAQCSMEIPVGKISVLLLLCSAIFDGAGHLISGSTGFGDSPPSYTGKQEWPELVGRNAQLAKAQLIAETHLQVHAQALH